MLLQQSIDETDRRTDGQTDRQTDGRTPYCYIDLAVDYQSSVNNVYNKTQMQVIATSPCAGGTTVQLCAVKVGSSIIRG